MKFILINPDYMLYGDPPLGLAYLASYLKKNLPELQVSILDQLNQEEIIKKLKILKPEVIGITAVSCNYFKVKELANRLKNFLPQSILILGGVHITTSPHSFDNSPFDFAILGEGEITAFKFLQSLIKNKGVNFKEIKKIKGILLREKNRVINTGDSEFVSNLDEIPQPARDLLNMNYYLLPRFSSEDSIEPIGTILTSRGCPYSCKFCSSSSFWKRKVRFFSAKRVAEEIELLYKKYNYQHIYVYDDLFSVNKARLREIISLLKKKQLLGKIRFSVYGRANCFDEEIADLLRQLNVHDLIFGFETGSQRMLSYLKGSGITVQQGIKAIDIAKKHGLNPGGFFMMGSPYETKEDLYKTYNFIKENCSKNFIIYQTSAFPKTEVWDYAIKNKKISEDFFEKKQKEFIDINPDIILSKDLSKEDFTNYFYKIKALDTKKRATFLNKLFMIRFRHIKVMLSKEFFKKVYNLNGNFIKRI